MEIRIFENISNTEYEKFNEDLNGSISNMQRQGMVVEVQYKVNTLGTKQLCYSALIIGRK